MHVAFGVDGIDQVFATSWPRATRCAAKRRRPAPSATATSTSTPKAPTASSSSWPRARWQHSVLTIAELREISAARLEDAQALFDAGHYDGVVYLCGYAVELALKARICETLDWDGYPSTNREFRELSVLPNPRPESSAAAQRAGEQNFEGICPLTWRARGHMES